MARHYGPGRPGDPPIHVQIGDQFVPRTFNPTNAELWQDLVSILLRIERNISVMTVRETQAWEQYNRNVEILADGYVSAVALNRVYEEQIAELSRSVQDRVNAAVTEALDGDSAADSDKIEHANAVMDAVLNDRPQPPAPSGAGVPLTGHLPTDVVTESGDMAPTPDVDPTTLPEERPDTTLTTDLDDNRTDDGSDDDSDDINNPTDADARNGRHGRHA